MTNLVIYLFYAITLPILIWGTRKTWKELREICKELELELYIKQRIVLLLPGRKEKYKRGNNIFKHSHQKQRGTRNTI